MVQRRKRFWALLCLLAMAGMLLLPMDASAAGSKGVGICVSFGESEEIRNAAPGIPIVVGDNRAVLTDTSLYEGSNLIYGVVTQGGNTYAMEYRSTLWGMALFSAASEDSGDFYSDLRGPKEGGRYTLLGITGDGELAQCTVTVSRVSTELNGNEGYDITIEGDNSKILSPAAIVEGDTLVAIRTGSRVMAVDTPTASSDDGPGGSNDGSSGSNGGGSDSSTGGGAPGRRPADSGKPSNPDIPLWAAAGGAVLIAVLAVLVTLLLKKRKPEPKPESWYQPELTQPVSVPTPPSAPAPRPVRLYLEIVDGPMTGQRYPVPDTGKLLLGRSLEANIRYPSDTRGVSRNHCQVFWNNGTLQVMDLGSTSGTYLRGKGQLAPRTPVPLTEGSVIYLGSKAVAVQLCARDL